MNTDRTKCPLKTALEISRYAVLECTDLDLSNEFDAAIYSVWYLLDPHDTKERKSVGTSEACRKVLHSPGKKLLRFTAHSHSTSLLTPSNDDLKIYSAHRRDKYIHFIVDRFCCRKFM